MSKLTRTLYLLLFLSVLLFLNRYVNGSSFIPGGHSAIWFHAGLLMLIVGMYWVEPYFTKPSDVVVNCLIAYVSISSLDDPPYATWWTATKYATVVLMIGSFVVVMGGSAAKTQVERNKLSKALYDLTTRLGSAEVVFSVVFVLGLLSSFTVPSERATVFVVFWLVVLLSKQLRIHDLVTDIMSKQRKARGKYLGEVIAFIEPNIARIALTRDAQCDKGHFVALTTNGIPKDDSPIGYTIRQRRGSNSVEIDVLLVDGALSLGKREERRATVDISGDTEYVQRRLHANRRERLPTGVGFAIAGSNISTLRVEVTQSGVLEEGHLLSVLDREKEIYYQITDAEIKDEKVLDHSERDYIVAAAEQLGTWDAARQGFVIHSWVAPENSFAYHITARHTVDAQEHGNLALIGRIPQSNFPIKISLQDLVLYHSAILGVTGAGKSFLAYELIERCASQGIKVICLDSSGDYKRYLQHAVRLESTAALEPFLNNTEGWNIGIVEFTEVTHPINVTKAIAEIAKKWCKDHRREEEIRNPVAKVLIVLEEAHTLIPEWNFNPERGLQETVNKTAQAVLQARKYGLGFMVVTQRTATVTKSILNQCNTIFAFQAFDETSYDFLKNYMGTHYVRALPNLQERFGIIVGKASTSAKPVITRFTDQQRQLQGVELPTITQVLEAHNAQGGAAQAVAAQPENNNE